MEAMGSVPERAAVGHGARGLQRGRQRLGLLQPRPGALARLPLGRGRDRRHLRRQADALLRARAVERQGPDPQGAPVRPHQQRRQPRRGREGVLLLPRQHAHPLVHEVPVQVSAGRLSVCPAGGHQQAARPAGDGVRAARYRRVRRRPLLRRVRRVRESRAGRHPHQDLRREPGPGARDAAPAADAVVPQHLELVAGRGEAAPEGRGQCDRRNGGRDLTPRVRRWSALLRGGAHAALHGERNQQQASLRHRKRHALRQGRVQRVSRPSAARGGEPGPDRHEGGGELQDDGRSRTDGCDPAAPHRRAGRGDPVRERVRRNVRRAAARGRRVLPIDHAAVVDRGRGARDAPGVRGHAVDEAVLLLRRRPVARGAPGPPAARPDAPDPQPRVVSHGERPRDLDAGQVGVPVVRGLGSRLPLHRAVGGRPGFRARAARADAARDLHAPERPDPGLRVELQRRQPAGARLGDAVPAPRRPGARRDRGHGVPEALLPQARAQLQLVGEPQGPPRQERVRGRLSRPRQHRRLRPQRAAAHRRPSRAGRRHRLGRALLPEHDRAVGRACRRRTELPGHVHEVRRALLRGSRPG